MAVAAAAAAAVYSGKQTRMYSSQADVVVYSASSVASTEQTLVMGTEKAIASSGAVLAIASRSLRVPESELQAGLSVAVPVDTNVLAISFSARNPQLARRMAQGLADAYVTYRAPEKANATGSKKTTLAAGQQVQPVIVTNASLPKSPTSPKRSLDVGVAALLGLALGIGAALIRDSTNDSLRGAADLEEQSGTRVLALIPAVRPKRGDPASQLVLVRNPDSAVAEVYREVRTTHSGSRLAGRQVDPGGEPRRRQYRRRGNLAVALARTNRRVVLMCADLRRPVPPTSSSVCRIRSASPTS